MPHLDLVQPGTGSGDLVIIAHGGKEDSLQPATKVRMPLMRMWPFALAAHQAAPEAAVSLMRYRYQGWNGDQAHAMVDLRQVLDRLPPEYERVALVGHSMGGRAVLRCGDDPRVVGVLALAPWLPNGEPLTDLRGRLVVTAHGLNDTVTDPDATGSYVRRLRADGLPVAEFSVADEGHRLLSRFGDWNELVARFVASCFGSGPPDPTLAEARTRRPHTIATPLPRWSHPHRAPRAVLGVLNARRRFHREPQPRSHPK